MSEEERETPREEIPFDEDPPVDPSVPQVGNSRARFVLPAEEADPEADDGAPAADDSAPAAGHGAPEADDGTPAADYGAPAAPEGGAGE